MYEYTRIIKAVFRVSPGLEAGLLRHCFLFRRFRDFRLGAQCLRPSSVFNVEVSALSEVRSGVLETLNPKP